MSRIVLVLLIATLGSGMVLVKSAYQARQLFAELDHEQNDTRRLEADHQRLLAERLTQATNLRVEKVAQERLLMRPITPAITQQVSLAASAVGGAGAGQ